MADLDALLDDCLDEFDEESAPAPSNPPPPPAAPAPSPPAGGLDAALPPTVEEFRRDMAAFMASEQGRAILQEMPEEMRGDEGEVARQMEQLFTMLQRGDKDATAAAEAAMAAAAPTAAAEQGGSGGGEERKEEEKGATKGADAISEALNSISGGAAAEAGAGGPPGGDDDLINRLMADLEKVGGAGGAGEEADPELVNSMVEQMMGSFMSKEVLYEPIKDMRAKYPAFLAKSRGKLPASEIERFERQYEEFGRILTLLDTDGHDKAEVVRMMNDMEGLGQPPDEIVAATGGLAPGAPAGPPTDEDLPPECKNM